mmetsp:Transcript_30682/g.22758  ORF Transcript_30682/g.22758 Transcript_30682/m.22758 type:complete len:143 (+) Transcript_30682:2310-2738(+)
MKGTYNTVVKYWSMLSQLRYDFFGSDRQAKDIKAFINNVDFLECEKQEELFNTIWWHLVSELDNDIDLFFDNEFYTTRVIFLCYLIYIVLIYFLIWRVFLKGLTEEIWKAKSSLILLPTDLCFRIEDIRQFIYRNSSTFGSA